MTEESHSDTPLLGEEHKSADSCINHGHHLQPLQKPGLVPTKRVCDCAQRGLQKGTSECMLSLGVNFGWPHKHTLAHCPVNQG